MTSKREEIYHKLLSRKVVLFDEIISEAEKVIGPKNRRYIFLKYVKKLLEEGKLERIRRGLYSVLSPLENRSKHVPDRFLVASKLREDYYLGYHTALEFYGCSYSHFNEVQIVVKKGDRFDPFKHKGLYFRPVFVQNTQFEVDEKEYSENLIRISSKERTFIDCLDRVKYAGGWEECLKSLQSLRGLNFQKLPEILENYDNDILRRKVGFVLDLLRDTSMFYEHLDTQILSRLREEIPGEPRYMTEGDSFIYDRKWQLYVPEDFEIKLTNI